jgi:capsular exopolysaccharide synthesis family protein
MSRVPPARLPLGRFLQIVWRRRLVFAATVVACFLAAGANLWTATRLYRATALVSVSPSTERDPDAAPSSSFLRAQGERIRSHAILALTLSSPEIKHLRTLIHQSNRLDALRDHVSTDIARTDGAISVSFDSPYPDEAPVIANAIVDAYRQYQIPGRTSDSDVVSLYQQQIDKIRDDLDATTARMQAFEQQYGVLTPGNDSASLPARRLAALSQELTSAQYDTLRAKSDYDEAIKALPKNAAAAMEPARPAPPAMVSADQEEKLRMEMIDLESRREAMQQRFLPGHPALQGIARQIDSVNRDYAAAVQGRWVLSQKREKELQITYDAQQKQVIELSAKTAEYQRLSADAERSHKAMDNLEARMAAIQDTRIAQGVNVEITDPAEGVVESYPRPISTLLTALVAGVLLGCGTAALRDWVDDRMVSAESIRSVMNLPVLGAVPQMPWVVSLTVSAQKVALDPTSNVAAAYRAIRATLDATALRNRYRTILITSPDASDGKTTSAANLAIAMAQTGKRVLLVDGVLETPMLHMVFGVSPNTGLSTILNGQTETPEKAIRRTAINNLWVLPAGITPPNPTDLLNTPAFSELLEQLADKYDHVIIDAPPLAELADARIMAASCDLSLLVLRADTATGRHSAAARDALLSVGAHIQGLILTRATRELQQDTNSQAGYRPKPPALPQEEEVDIIDIGASPT